MIFLLATWPTCSITWPGHMTKRGKNTQRSTTIFSCLLPLTRLITRGEILLLLTLNFSSLINLPIPLFLWSERKHFKTFSNYVFAKFQLHLSQFFQRHFQIMSLPKSNCISSNLFQDIFKVCLCPIPIASHRKYSEIFSNYVFAKFHLHLIELIIRHYQIIFLPNFPLFACPVHTLATGV